MFALSKVKQTNQKGTSLHRITISCIAIPEYRPGSFVSYSFEIHSQDRPPRSFVCSSVPEAHLELKEWDQQHRRILSLTASWKESKRTPRPNFQWMEIYSLKYYRCGRWSPHICFHITDEKKPTTVTFDCLKVLIFYLSQVLSSRSYDLWPLTFFSLWSKTECEIPSNIWKPLFCGSPLVFSRLNISCLFSLLFWEQSPNPWPF